jgi:transaldolase
MNYFLAVKEQTPTRLWVNNPTAEEMDLAIAAGAISMTSNPAYASALLRREPEFMERVINAAWKETVAGRNDAKLRPTNNPPPTPPERGAGLSFFPSLSSLRSRDYGGVGDGPGVGNNAELSFGADLETAMELANRQLIRRAAERFRPLFEESGGACGFVTIQGDPLKDHDVDWITAEALRYRELGPNVMPKIPVVAAGLEAIARLVAQNIPVCATEVFSLAQAVCACESYERAARPTGKFPPFFVTHITGIFDEYLQNTVREQKIELAPGVLDQAGCAVARREYQLIRERGYRAILLGGGVRHPRHFTELVGGEIHVTMNWNTIAETIQSGLAVIPRHAAATPPAALAELSEKLPDFRKAFDLEGLSVAEFADYGPVRFFRDMFLKGQAQLRGALERQAMAVGAEK